jgi:uncharacterized protein related to proFAR isomerase
MPCLMLRHGEIVIPGENGPTVARTPDGGRYDLFEVVDSLNERFGRIYLVDLDGVEDGDPQLDYLQEIARDTEIWLDAGARTADEAIDALVTGATRAVLSTSTLRSREELERAWGLSQELAMELELRGGRVVATSPAWAGRPPEEVTREVREVGPSHLILSPRDGVIDWEMVRAVARGGPTWVGGIFQMDEADRLSWCGAVGGIFHLGGDLITTAEGSPWRSFPRDPPGAR